MVKRISILGSTGSIGTQALEVMSSLGISPVALTANRNTALLEYQARKYHPKLVVLKDEDSARTLKIALADTGIRVSAGDEGLIEAATINEAEMVLTSIVGMAGLLPTLAAIDTGRDIALANKETLVCAGEIITQRAKEKGVRILPVDSEHSAIFQCLQGCPDRSLLRRIILTASGGPFFGKSAEELKDVTVEQALKHPNWSMGAKITVDSATLMNKGLEFIEAMWLFGLSPDEIDIVIHRESIVHSMVEFVDGSILAQMGVADMRVPISYALTYPERKNFGGRYLDFLNCPALTFAPPDSDTFQCLKLAMTAARAGGTAGAILNGANEAAVDLFLKGKIRFLQIGEFVLRAVDKIQRKEIASISDIIEADAAAREAVCFISD